MTKALRRRLEILESARIPLQQPPPFIIRDHYGRPLWVACFIAGQSVSWKCEPDSYQETVDDPREIAPIKIDLEGYGRMITRFETGEPIITWELES